ncbi:MAG TPA: hypothetical protein VF472_06950 [Burkholderiaceae bacterium]
MTDNNLNPYAPPEPLEEVRKPVASPADRPTKERSRAASVLWWLYFCGYLYLTFLSLRFFARSALGYGHWDFSVNQAALMELVQLLSLAGMFCYLRRIRLLHSFVWGMVAIVWLIVSVYQPALSVFYASSHDVSIPASQIASLCLVYLMRLPALYALWRYSSTRSPVWKQPRIQWRKHWQRLMEAIVALRRA